MSLDITVFICSVVRVTQLSLDLSQLIRLLSLISKL